MPALFTITTHGELHPFINQEWYLTNGIGGFASSTVVGCNTRRYHGLLCAATKPPVGRVMLLNRVGELLRLGGKADTFELSINHFGGGAMHPRGDKHLRQFSLGRSARWEYEVEGVRIIKELQLKQKQNVAGLRYTIEPNGQAVELQLLPFVSLRDFHALQQAGRAQFAVHADAWDLRVSQGEQTLVLRADAGEFTAKADWWYGHKYPLETERGLDDTEDLFVPGALTYRTSVRSTVTLWASTDGPGLHEWEDDVAGAWNASAGASLPIQKLMRAANDFVVDRKRPDGKPGTTVIAGYPWFSDWGRDTMIALPGLLLSTGRFDQAREVLGLFAEYVSQGMIPNRFDDYDNTPSYNTVDASLWFVHACYEYLKASGDKAAFEAALKPACLKVIEGYRIGTRFNIHMDPKDALITFDDPQLTWMDAKCGDTVFTPRDGKAVEINALWYNALRLTGHDELAARVQAGFVKAFWINAFRGLADVVKPDGRRDESIRPNQIFAVSLPHSPLNHDQQHTVVEVVRRELLTPFGLRTLNRADTHYRGRYTGPQMQRDACYHQGTVWPWPIGAFLDAYLKVHDHSADAVRQCRVWLQPLLDHMNTACIGQISEIFEADEPHRPVGCPAQAWSVSEVLRLAKALGV